MKHCLAANILPKLVEDFDEKLKEYKKVCRKKCPDKCVHSVKSSDKSSQKVLNEKNSSDNNEHITEKDNVSLQCDKTLNQVSNTIIKSEIDVKPLSENEKIKESSYSQSVIFPLAANCPTYNARNTLNLSMVRPQSPSSVSCSPHSYYSSSSSPVGSPLPPQNISNQNLGILSLLPENFLPSSPSNTPEASPNYFFSPINSPKVISPASSPPPSLSPIKCPSDWDEDFDDRCDSGLSDRFSPTVPDTSCQDSQSIEDEEENLFDDCFEEDSATENQSELNQSIVQDIGQKLNISQEPVVRKRSLSPIENQSNDLNDIKRPKTIEDIEEITNSKSEEIISEENDKQMIESSNSIENLDETKKSSSEKISTSADEAFEEVSNKDTGIKEFGQIKFRVGKKLGSRRQVTFHKTQSRTSIDDLWQASEAAMSLKVRHNFLYSSF